MGSINKYCFRFTLDNDMLGPKGVLDPIGYDTNPLRLERHKEFHSVLETYESSLVFYREALDYLKSAKALGLDTKVTIVAELSSDYGATYELFFDGLIDLPNLELIATDIDETAQGAVKKDDIWSLFLSRKDTQVNVCSATDLDDNAVTPAVTETINLPAQVVRKQLSTEMWSYFEPDFVDLIYSYTGGSSSGFVVDLPKVIADEIETKYHYPGTSDANTATLRLIDLVEAWTKGDFSAQLVCCANGGIYNTKLPVGIKVRIIYLNSPTTFTDLTRTDLGSDGVDGRTIFTLAPVTVNDWPIGSSLEFFFYNLGSTPFDIYIVPNDIFVERSYFSLLAHTISVSSTSEAIRTGVVFDALIKRLTGADRYVSDFFDPGGCGYEYVHMLGLHLRGKSFADQPFSTSFGDWFKDADALQNLGLGYEYIGGEWKFVVDKKEVFYDSTSNSINLNRVRGIHSVPKTDRVFNAEEIGYSKWQLSSGGSLIDDPQTIHNYATPLKYVGVGLSILCRWVAASLLFELTRRATTKSGETFDLDNEIFVLKTNGSDPELDYISATDLTDPAERYNKKETPGRIFLRWINVFNVGLQQYLTRSYKFISGVGNFKAEITITPDSCSGSDQATVNESADIPVTNVVLHGVDQITFEHDLNWDQYKLIRDNKRKSIGVSTTNDNHVPYFIDSIEFYVLERRAKFVLFSVS